MPKSTSMCNSIINLMYRATARRDAVQVELAALAAKLGV